MNREKQIWDFLVVELINRSQHSYKIADIAAALGESDFQTLESDFINLESRGFITCNDFGKFQHANNWINMAPMWYNQIVANMRQLVLNYKNKI
jgi:predicted transcriptional regulator